MSIPGDEREVDILQACLSSAGSVLLCPVDRILRQAVDVERGTPFCSVAAIPIRPRDPAGGIKLHLRESRTRVLANKIARIWIGIIKDVRIAVRGTGADL